MSTLFVPGAKHDYVHVDYWGALSEPSRIHQFDWADYILQRLLGSAAKFKADINNVRLPYPKHNWVLPFSTG